MHCDGVIIVRRLTKNGPKQRTDHRHPNIENIENRQMELYYLEENFALLMSTSPRIRSTKSNTISYCISLDQV